MLTKRQMIKEGDHPVTRRHILKRTGRIGLLAATTLLSGGLIGYRPGVSLAGTAATGSLPGRPYHHTADGFRNPPGSHPHKHDLTAWIRHIRREINRKDPKLPDGHFLGQQAAERALIAAASGNRLTWLGHSTFLLRLGGRNILLDPFLSEHATSKPPFGPKRFTPPGLPLEKLPAIDLLLISHNHYDHLDRATLKALPGKRHIAVVVPLRLKPFFSALGYRNVTELDWHDTKRVAGITVTALPAVHYSSRGLFDRNETLWAGYLLGDGQSKVYFAGDTAYHTLFKELGRRYGPIDLGMVPIGAYKRASKLKSTHATPEGAVQIGRDLGVKTLVPMHWGTIVLSYEPPFEPPVRFLQAGRTAGFSENDLWQMAVGESRMMAG